MNNPLDNNDGLNVCLFFVDIADVENGLRKLRDRLMRRVNKMNWRPDQTIPYVMGCLDDPEFFLHK